MKILVIDDNPINLEAAKAQLKGHEVTTANSYDEGAKLLGPQYDEGRVEKLLIEEGLIRGECDKTTYWLAKVKVERQCLLPFGYDAVLVDLLMPASPNQLAPRFRHLAREEMPIGIFLALFAAKSGARYVAVFSDVDHHSHPATACFDNFITKEAEPEIFEIGAAKFLLSCDREWLGDFDQRDLTKQVGDYFGQTRPGTVRSKNWRALFDYLTKK